MILLWMIKGEKWGMGGKELRHLFKKKALVETMHYVSSGDMS
jgi:hypothetical protein